MLSILVGLHVKGNTARVVSDIFIKSINRRGGEYPTALALPGS